MTVHPISASIALVAAVSLAACLGDASPGASADTADASTTADVSDAGDDTTASPACGGDGLQCAGQVAIYCAAGEVVASADCPAWGRACLAGACYAEVCTPGAAVCVGDAVGTCEASGLHRAIAPCDPGEVCVADDAGAVCIAGSCVPGTSSCVGDAVAACVAADEPPELTPCEAGSHCAAGACVPDGSCELPVIVLEGEETVAPHTIVQLSAARPDLSYRWSVAEEPSGATTVLTPNAQAAAVGARLDVVGAYRVALEATDMNGQACGVAERTLTVAPATAVHVELVWSTPLDPDPNDVGPDAGSDLDLHVVTPIQPGGPQGVDLVQRLFDDPWDTYWFTRSPNSAPIDPAVDDDARLLRDDTDGAGPETVGVGLPHTGADYLIAVHGWADHGFGTSHATLRVYVYGALVFSAERPVEALDLWPAAVLRWPSGEVVPVGGCGGLGEVLCTGDDACQPGEPCLPVTWPGYLPPDFGSR